MFTSVYPWIERERLGEGVCTRDVFSNLYKAGMKTAPLVTYKAASMYILTTSCLTEILYDVHIIEFYEREGERGREYEREMKFVGIYTQRICKQLPL